MKEKNETLLDKFKTYREEEKHEFNLLSSRVNALLYSQAFLVAGAAVLFDRKEYGTFAFLVISIVAFAMNWITSIALCINCQVLRQWHRHGMDLIKQDEGRALRGFYLAGRTQQPDSRHRWSTDYFSWSIPGILGAGWLLAIWDALNNTIHGHPVLTGLVVFAFGIVWGVSMRVAFLRAGNLLQGLDNQSSSTDVETKADAATT